MRRGWRYKVDGSLKDQAQVLHYSPTMATAADFEKLSHHEQILALPDTYIGSTHLNEEGHWLFDPEIDRMVWRQNVAFNPGLYKIFDEIIVNARDAFVRGQTKEGYTPIKKIDVSVERTEGGGAVITVANDGDGIPIEEHPEYKVWVPELIFGHLLTSSNYKKGEEKIVGGKNGYGAKLANIFSRRFTVETRCTRAGKSYSQTWRRNMFECEKPVIKRSAAAKGMTSITFEPDLDHLPGGVSDDMFAVFHTRTVELAALVGASGAKVSWNGETIATNSFEKFTKLFLAEGAGRGATIAYEQAGERWEVAACLTRQLYSEEDGVPDDKHISFVNGINTYRGGKHVETVARHILAAVCEEAAKKKKKIDIKPGQIKDSVVFFINATIVNPGFNSQTKECLTTAVKDFGSTPKWSGKLVEGLMKLGIMDEVILATELKAARDVKKTDGKKRSTISGIPKLTDALWAGTAKSDQCTLILTEGDSAATSAISGLAIVGREKFGVFPLKGKLLNVKDISIEKFSKNEELTAIKQILGLEQRKVYSDVKSLRYGRVMIMTDQDHDGSHIKGLLMNFFHTEWPSLLKAGFLCSLLTPIIKATKGKQMEQFYSIPAFEAWKEARGGETRGWTIKYYKGLGTSTPAEAREWFKSMNEIKYEWCIDTDGAINLAFNKKNADDRKTWLMAYDSTKQLDTSTAKVPIGRFVHDELIHFSNADTIRSIPSLMDGLKPSQRKILFGCLKRNLRSEVKVAQLAGYVSEHAAYHHGEASLTATIVGMAQNFIGSNNINLLKPNGQFGSRLQGGKDAASPRYIFTCLERIVDTIFRKEDAAVLKYLDDDGMAVEPEYYMPVIPMIVVNGTVGIGTGFSSNIPPYNPEEVVALLKARLTDVLPTLEGRQLNPWWFGFSGTQVRTDDNTWTVRGLYEFVEATHQVRINELPVGLWTMDYKEFLDKTAAAEKLEDRHGLIGFEDHYNDIEAKFVLQFSEEAWDDYYADRASFEKRFKMVSSFKTTNMHCFDFDGTIRKFDTIGDIMEQYFARRIIGYDERKEALLAALEAQLIELRAKLKFVRAILADELVIARQTDERIVEQLLALELPALSDASAAESVKGYDYLLRMRIDRIKQSAVDELEREAAAAEAAYEELEGKTPEDLWMEDLEEFEEAWVAYAAERRAEYAAVIEDGSAAAAAAPKKKIKRAVRAAGTA